MLALAFAVAIFGAALWLTVASAGVHDNDVFELEANVADDTANSPNVGDNLGTDWEVICREYTSGPGASDPSADECALAAGPASGAIRQIWLTDDFLNTGSSDDQPATGATKDTNDIDGWDCKISNISPPKNDMLHSGAAVYTVGGQQVVYFFLDRINSDNGNANVGFWFMKGEKACPAVAGGGAVNFTGGPHALGDVLVTSAFTGGGGVSEILVFEWCSDPTAPDLKCGDSDSVVPPAAGSGDGPLQLIASGADCRPLDGSPVNPAVCATVNKGGVKAGGGPNGDPAIPADPAVDPIWEYAGAGNPSNEYEPGALFEGGVNTSALGLDLGCGGTFLADTRSSQSPTAQLHDFSLGQLSFCEASMATVPSVGSGTEVAPGTSVSDTATVTGTASGTTPPTPTGNVTFFLCGPSDLTPINTGTCDSGGTQVGGPVALVPGAVGVASATSTTVAPTVPGKYCFRATWPGDTNYAGALTENNSAAECFTVRTIATTTVTTPSDASGVALSSPVAFGTTLFDKAVVTAAETGGGNVVGAVNFFLCDPTQVQGGTGTEVCATGGTALSGNARTLVPIGAASPPASMVLSSPGVAANAAGVWCFRAVFVPGNSTYTGSSDASHSECVTVSPTTTTTVTTPSTTSDVAVNTVVTDYALVTGVANAGTPTGSIAFYVCDPSQLTPANTGVCAAGTGSLVSTETAAAVAASNPPQSDATSDNVTLTVVGKWCFRAAYTSTNANYLNSADAGSEGECLTVKDTTSGTSEQDWLPNDSATFTSLGGTALNGTVTFSLHSGLTCAGTAIAGTTEQFTLTDEASPATRSTTNSTVLVKVSQDVSWLVVFASSDPLVGGSQKCETTSLTIDNDPT